MPNDHSELPGSITRAELSPNLKKIDEANHPGPPAFEGNSIEEYRVALAWVLSSQSRKIMEVLV